MTEKMREEFEAWVKRHNESLCEDGFDQPEDIQLDRQGGVYIWANAESAWLAWQASRESLVIELPPSLDGDLNDYGAGYVNGSMQMRENCIDAIEAAGVKVK